MVPELLLRLLSLDEDDDAPFLRVLTVDHLVPDGHTDDVRPGEDRGFVGHLRGPHIEGHCSSLPFQRADLEEAFADLPARGGAGPAGYHGRHENQENDEALAGVEV